MTEEELAIVRRTYARHIFFASGSDDPRLEAALFDVRRDAFMGPGPWEIGGVAGPRRTPDADPSWLFQDVLVGLIPEKALNNGQPSFLASLIALGRIRAGEHVVHVGAGVGYYTAIMAELAGRGGQVTAIEYEPTLAARAAETLGPYPQVQTVCGDGSRHPFEPADVILINAGASRPLDHWLDRLKDGGRLIVPLTIGFTLPGGAPMARGHIFLIEHQGDDYRAACKGPTAIYPCLGADDAESEASLKEALRVGGQQKVRRLRRTSDVPSDRCWARGPGWALTFD